MQLTAGEDFPKHGSLTDSVIRTLAESGQRDRLLTGQLGIKCARLISPQPQERGAVRGFPYRHTEFRHRGKEGI